MNQHAATPSSVDKPLRSNGIVKRLVGIAALALAGAFAFGAANAQEAIVKTGDAVVTGYSGITATPAPAGANPFDYIGIDLTGASARVVDLTALGPQGGESAAPKTFTVSPDQVGQVFGVTLDDANDPNIYLAATSVYGLSIGVPDAGGQLKRVQHGQPGANFLSGQFGPPDEGGSAGSIWRVDGTTGDVSLFASVGSSASGAASLGGLAYDPSTRQIFVAERSTGIIYRYGLDGTEQGTYDHGVEGRPDAGLPPIPLSGPTPVDITSPVFDSTNPTTWGFAPPARRIFALAVHAGRLFYSIAQGPQIWSVRINAGGSVSGDARLEVEVPSLQDGVEITSIAFDSQGRMYMAERGATTGDYTMYALANGGQSRVLRYIPTAGGGSSDLWEPAAEQYSVGMAPDYNNADGGVALGYGYASGNSGSIDFNACSQTVWSTGERLLDTGDPAAPPGSFPYVDGLQGNDINLVQPQNTPPTASWFIDYDDKAGYPDFRGYAGAVATLPCAGQAAPPPVVCPPGTYFDGGQCVIPPSCPPGTTYQNGQCVYPTCPPGFYLQNGQCLPPPVVCPPGTFYYQGQCFPLNCPPGTIKLPNGKCVPQGCPPNMDKWKGQCVPKCPPGTFHMPPNGVCLPPIGCPPNMEKWQGQCVPKCPPGTFHMPPNGLCLPPIGCPPNMEKWQGQCVPKCPPGFSHKPPNGMCMPTFPPPVPCLPPMEKWNGQCVPKCPPGFFHTPPNGACKPKIILPPPGTLCLPPKEKWNGQCVNKCPPGFFHTPPNGACKPKIILPPPGTLCLPPKEKWNGLCVDKCPPGFFHTPPNGACKPKIILPPPGTLCLPPKEKWNGLCVDKCPPGFFHTPPNGACKPKIILPPPGTLCLPPKEKWNGLCVDKCPPGFFHTPPNGACKPKIILPPPGTLCLPPKEKWNGLCVDKCPPGFFHTPPNGACKPKIILPPPGTLCLPPKEKWNGLCVNKCPTGFVHMPPNGACLPKLPPLPPKP